MSARADEVEKAIADAAWRVDCLSQRMDTCEDKCADGMTNVMRDGKSALSQLAYIAERYVEQMEDEGNSAANSVLLRNKNDIQRWMKAVEAAGLQAPKVFGQNRMWK